MRPAILYGSIVLVLWACTEPPTAPTPIPATRAASVTTSSSPCVTPTVTVNDETGLRNALASATPGSVIALDGMIRLTDVITVTQDTVTLTCTGHGSGLWADYTDNVAELLFVQAASVTISGLILDASGTTSGALEAFEADDGSWPADLHFGRNQVYCGAAECMLLQNARAAVIANNQFIAFQQMSTGIHIQSPLWNGGADLTRVENNTITAYAPTVAFSFGAIRVFGGNSVRIAGNTVSGPWQNGLALTKFAFSNVDTNHISGALRYGIATTSGSDVVTSLSYNYFAGNMVHRNGFAGVLMYRACYNTFFDNNLLDNPGNIGLIFANPNTGANTYVAFGTPSGVIDNGGFDCNGDGVNDPNTIIGAASAGVASASALGATPSESSASSASGRRLY